jgi:hypothetical protein
MAKIFTIKVALDTLDFMHKIALKIYRDGEMVPPLRKIAPRDAIKVTQPLHVFFIKTLNK